MPDSSWLCPEGKYSIFTRRPQPPPLSAYPIQASANRKRDQAVLSGLDDALDEGPASLTLQEILRRESKAERGRAKYRAYEAGKRSAGKKRASSSNDDDTRDQGSANDAGDEFTEGAESQVKRRKRERQSATPEVDSELPQVPRPQTEMPDGACSESDRCIICVDKLLARRLPLKRAPVLVEEWKLQADLYSHRICCQPYTCMPRINSARRSTFCLESPTPTLSCRITSSLISTLCTRR